MVLSQQQNQGQKIFFFVAANKNFAAATKPFVYRTEHFVVTIYFFIPISTNDFVGITKPFFPWHVYYQCAEQSPLLLCKGGN